MNQRIFVIAGESTTQMSQAQHEELMELLELLSKRYNFKVSTTFNANWVRALADEMEARR